MLGFQEIDKWLEGLAKHPVKTIVKALVIILLMVSSIIFGEYVKKLFGNRDEINSGQDTTPAQPSSQQVGEISGRGHFVTQIGPGSTINMVFPPSTTPRHNSVEDGSASRPTISSSSSQPGKGQDVRSPPHEPKKQVARSPVGASNDGMGTTSRMLERFDVYKHAQTGLMYAIIEVDAVTWHQAKEHTRQLHGQESSDWRLPTLAELRLLSRSKQPLSGIDSAHSFWAESEDPTEASAVNITTGKEEHHVLKSSTNYALIVRSYR